MNHHWIVRREAEADITDAALRYDEQERGLGEELVLEIRAAIQRAVKNPLHFLLLRRRPEIRRVLGPTFSLSPLLHRS